MLLDPHKVNVGVTVFVAVRTNAHTQAWFDRFKTTVEAIPHGGGVLSHDRIAVVVRRLRTPYGTPSTPLGVARRSMPQAAQR